MPVAISKKCQKKEPVDVFTSTGSYKIRRYLLSRLLHYHRLKLLNFCVRDGNRCDQFDMFAGRDDTGLFARCHLIQRIMFSYIWFVDGWVVKDDESVRTTKIVAPLSRAICLTDAVK
jgi:hypothetical protein